MATSGDTGSAVAHAFHDVPHTRVVILYPEGRVSPTQEAQLTMFNGEATNVRAYAVAGSFDDCQRLTQGGVRRPRAVAPRASDVGQLDQHRAAAAADDLLLPRRRAAGAQRCATVRAAAVVSTPSGNFGNLTAGLMAKRAGLPIDTVRGGHQRQRRRARHIWPPAGSSRAPSIQTIANAMDVGNPSNFDRLLWLYGGDLDAMRRDIAGSRHTATTRCGRRSGGSTTSADTCSIRTARLRIWGSKISRAGTTGGSACGDAGRSVGMFLATAHPAKFREIVEPIIGRAIEKPAPLVDALARPRHILRIDASLDAVKDRLLE